MAADHGAEPEESIMGFFLFVYFMGSDAMRYAANEELMNRAADFHPNQTQIMHKCASNILGAYVESLGRTPSPAELVKSIRAMTKGFALSLDYLDDFVAWHLSGSPGFLDPGADQYTTAAAVSLLILITLDLSQAEVRQLIRRAESDARALGVELTPMWKRSSAQTRPGSESE